MAIGPVAGIPVGAHFTNRRSLYLAGLHRDIRRGICGSGLPGRGAESVVLSGGYEDDLDLGDVVYYTGQGGRSRTGEQVAEQTMSGLNASLARNADTGDPVRIVRATPRGFRYDGLYDVEDAWLAPGKRGFVVCRYRLRSRDESFLPEPNDSAELPRPAGRQLVTHYRLARDGRVPQAVKEMYGYACQICGVRLEIAGGLYAEGAHLVPLGGGQEGVDHISNVLCLCPNHHVLLDHGAIALTDDWKVIDRSGAVIGGLTVHDEHGLNPEYARLHRMLLAVG